MIYATHVFDCDGVILDSNGIKEYAFYKAAMEFGATPDEAQELIDYHRSAGAIGRRARVEYFVHEIMEDRYPGDGMIDAILAAVTKHVVNGMARARVMYRFKAYAKRLIKHGVLCVCVSGIEQEELKAMLDSRGLSEFFGAHIYGTSDKTYTLDSLVRNQVVTLPAVYYGDTEDDYRAARSAGLDFVLVYSGQAANSPLRAVRDFGELLKEKRGT